MKTIFGLFVLCAILFSIAVSVHGIYLAFSASVLLGFVVLIVEPAPFVIGLVSLFWGVNLAEKVLAALS